MTYVLHSTVYNSRMVYGPNIMYFVMEKNQGVVKGFSIHFKNKST